MNLIDLLLIVFVAIVCGAIAQLTSRYSRGGLIVNLLFGFLGAFAGVVASRWLNAPEIYDLKMQTGAFPVMYAIIGSVFFLAAIGLFVKPGR
jgi:uncharacterized membrane protein YeaQ/YmgE (transglycosylase-associated protein family)